MRRLLGLALCLLATSAAALEVVETPLIRGIDERTLEQRGAAAYAARVDEAAARGGLGCRRHCAAIERATRRVLAAARTQGEAARRIDWRIRIVSGDSAEALAMPGGQIFLSEGLIDQLSLNDAEIAFVLAHETAHVLLQHERQTLAVANAMVQPRGVSRSVDDLYFQMGFDFGLLLRLQPVLKAAEAEADEAGLMLGALAGYQPARMLGFLRKLSVTEGGTHALLATHPDGAERLAALQRRLPLAQRIWLRYGGSAPENP
jgi:Zn-dependent protease with chaperone function